MTRCRARWPDLGGQQLDRHRADARTERAGTRVNCRSASTTHC